MNGDFEMELAVGAGSYRRRGAFAKINRTLAKHLLWLAAPGDTLLLEDGEEGEDLRHEAASRGIETLSVNGQNSAIDGRRALFTPWGWTASALEIGKRAGAIVEPVSLDIVRRVNSKLWSFALEQELGIAMPGASAASTFEELMDATRRACPNANDKWVIKSPFGFAARDRVLGRGPELEGPPATWARRRIAKGETLIFQPWLQVIREYGVAMFVGAEGQVNIEGISHLKTNGAGTGLGYWLGSKIDPVRRRELEEIAIVVGDSLFRAGYTGPVGMDALEHRGGLQPLLEINARYTMGFVALAVEQSLAPDSTVLWSIK